VLSIGTPANNTNSITLSPQIGTLINFDDLASSVSSSATIDPVTGFPLFALPSNQYASQGVASISNSGSQLFATFISQQSAPVYLTTGSSDNFAGDITIALNHPNTAIGIGVSSDGTTPITLKAFGASDNLLATFSGLVVPTTGPTPNNAYYVVSDPTGDIQSLEIISSQNLGIDDLQIAPEPSEYLVTGGALAFLAFLRFRRRKS